MGSNSQKLIEEISQNITGLSLDSRTIKPGMLFAALKGHTVDGHDFIEAAIQNGARYILADKGTVLPDTSQDVTLVDVDDVKTVLAEILVQFYAPKPQKIVAITGTNGKTSSAVFAAQIWEALGLSSAALGTLGIISAHYEGESQLTTPNNVQMHQALSDMAKAGIERVVMEASSIGIEQRRLEGLELSGALYTNLSQDHLDYHHDMESYYLAKQRLFDLLPVGAPAIICVDDEAGVRMAAYAKSKKLNVITFGAQGDVNIIAHSASAGGQNLRVRTEGQVFDLFLPLPGLFQGLNALGAALLVMACEGLSFQVVAPFLSTLKGVRGRLEAVEGHSQEAYIYVDYAHTPAGLETVLQSLRAHTKGRLICLFGCGGERDTSKRPLMGRAVDVFADISILTDDNPRGEDPALIRAQAKEGAPDAIEIAGRAEAIRYAVRMLQAGDVLVIAGKGHESGQEIAGTIQLFDDVKEAKAAIEELKNAL